MQHFGLRWDEIPRLPHEVFKALCDRIDAMRGLRRG